MRDKRIVLDSSVIAALHFPEPFSVWCEKIIEQYDEFYTVDIAYSEIANVAWKRIFLFKNPKDKVLINLNKALQFIDNLCTVLRSRDLIMGSISIAIDCGIAVYDALFLSIAVEQDMPLATLDKTFVNKLRDTKYIDVLLHPYKQP